ncbi:MAG TPA: VCBS repeat-containing protein [Gammaproteobacteria bacterium]|jgi:hypothetical protein
MCRVSGTLLAVLLGVSLCYAAPVLALGPGVTIATAAMNGDGTPDLVELSTADSTVNVVTVDAKGDFTLLPPQTFADITQMSSIAVADVNGDGIADVIISDSRSSAAGVRILMNDGHGNLAADASYPSEISAGVGPVSVIAADINDDGKPDLVTANGSDGSVSILINNGDGTFATPVTYAAGTDPVAVAVGDLNGDGFPDLVVADSASNSVQVLLNNGDGTFAGPVAVPDGNGPVAVVLADVNGDGHLDIVVADGTDSKMAVLIGTGDGSFAAPVFYDTGADPGWVAAQDLSGDGRLDLVTANYSDGSVSVFANAGGGKFVPTQRVYPAYGSYDTVIMDVAGKPQLISANVSAGAVVVTPASVSTKSNGGSASPSVTRKIQGAQDPQSSSGSGAFDLLSLLLLAVLGLSRRFVR